MRWGGALAGLVFLAAVSSTWGGEPDKAPTIEQLEQQQKMDDLHRQLKNLERTQEEMQAFLAAFDQDRRSGCLKAFGHPGFCDCLREKVPSGVFFGQYVGFVTFSREDIGYDDMSDSWKATVDNTRAARDVCV